MDLFSHLIDKNENQLPKDGVVNYYGQLLSQKNANLYLDTFLNTISWQDDEYFIAGKHIIPNRKIAWFGTAPPTKIEQLQDWTNDLLILKNKVETETNEHYNSCLLNLYHNGNESLGWHSDSETGAVASLSLGATRKFVFKHKKTKEKVSFNLTNGDLLVMKGSTQTHWLHCVPPTKKVLLPRINLTFRKL